MLRFKNFINNISKYIFPIAIICIGIFLSWQNYTPGTWLSGWDTLHPEFNFALNFKRVLFGVWRPEQGVGAVAAHSHISELPRILYLWLMSLFFPLSALRYLYFFTALILGPLGVYFFIKNYTSKFPAFLGSLYYLLNPGTLQHFYVPFEMFATQYAFLPWIFYLCLKYLKTGQRIILFALFVTSWFASPQAYAATLFYVFLVAIFLFVFSINVKRGLIILLVILTANLYWLLPNIYSVIDQSRVIESSQINKLFSEEAFLRNKEYGTWQDISIHRSFLFSWKEFDFESDKFVDLLDEWNHINLSSKYNFGYSVLCYFYIRIYFLGTILKIKCHCQLHYHD